MDQEPLSVEAVKRALSQLREDGVAMMHPTQMLVTRERFEALLKAGVIDRNGKLICQPKSQ
jgi:hypothetical protein